MEFTTDKLQLALKLGISGTPDEIKEAEKFINTVRIIPLFHLFIILTRERNNQNTYLI